MTLDDLELHKFEFSVNFLGFRRFRTQQQLNAWSIVSDNVVSTSNWSNFGHALASRGFVSDSWAFLLLSEMWSLNIIEGCHLIRGQIPLKDPEPGFSFICISEYIITSFLMPLFRFFFVVIGIFFIICQESFYEGHVQNSVTVTHWQHIWFTSLLHKSIVVEIICTSYMTCACLAWEVILFELLE